MKKTYLITLFLLILAINLAGIVLKNESLQYYSKPFLMIILGTYFILQTKASPTRLKIWILAALFFSWAGDVLLIFQENRSLFFLLGLSAFLLAHVFYIVFFHNIRLDEEIKSNPWLLLIVVIYYAILMSLLSPFLGTMKLQVRIYGIVISFMLLLAMHMLFIKNRTAGKWMFFGAFLFVISDSVLAINKFYQSFEGAGIIIMLTYGLAQLFIIEGAIRYITSRYKE